MSILTRLLGATGRRAAPSIWDDFWYQPVLYNESTAAGVDINQQTIQQLSPMFAGMRVISETLATIPLILYRAFDDDSRERARDLPLFNLLHRRPNPYQTSTEWREQMQCYFTLWGKAAAAVIRQNGRPMELHTIHPDRVYRRMSESGYTYYDVLLRSGRWEPWTLDRVLYLEAFGGRSPIQLARDSAGLTMASERHGARFFANDARPGGVLQTPNALSDRAYKRLKEHWNKAHQGVENAHALAILEEGTEWKGISISSEDAQLLETRRFQVEESARWLNIPPHILQDLTRATFSNIEHKSLEFIVYSMRPWFVRWEQAIDRDLIMDIDRRSGDIYAEFLVDGLVRGDIQTRYEAYQKAINNGWLSPNDVRRLENQNPIEGGDQYFIPMNLIPLKKVDEFFSSTPLSPPPDDSDSESNQLNRYIEMRAHRTLSRRRKIHEASLGMFRDIGSRIVRREVNDIRRSMKKQLRSIESFEQWLRDYYDEYPEVVSSMSLPTFRSFSELIHAAANEEIGADVEIPEAFIRAYVEQIGIQHSKSSMYQLLDLIDSTEVDVVSETLGQRLDEWEEKRPKKYADRMVWEGGSAVAKAVWASGGVSYLRWIANANACDLCETLDGMIVAIDAPFVPKGGTVDPQNGITTPLTSSKSVTHPQLHGGCSCMIAPDTGAF